MASDPAAIQGRTEPLVDISDSEKTLAEIPIAARPPSDLVPLTPMQRMPWCAVGERHRRNSLAFILTGSIDVDLLRQSIQALVARHQSLRTSFVCKDGVQWQRVSESTNIDFELIDLAKKKRAYVGAMAMREAQRFSERELDLSTDSVIGTLLVRTGSNQHTLVISLDHLVTDAVSSSIIMQEIWHAYFDAANGKDSSLPKSALQFPDYASWVASIYPYWKRTHQAFWVERLADVAAPRWPENAPCNRGADLYATRELRIDAATNGALMQLSQREKVFPSLVVLAVFSAAVLRWCNQREVVIVLVDNGRFRPDLQTMVGFLATHLHLRVQLNGNPSFLTFLRNIVEEISLVYLNRDFDYVPSTVPHTAATVLFNWIEATGTQRETRSDSAITLKNVSVPISRDRLIDATRRLPYTLLLGAIPGVDGMRMHVYGKGAITDARVGEFADKLFYFLRTVLRSPMSRIDEV